MSTSKTPGPSDARRNPTEDQYLELEQKVGAVEAELAADIAAADEAPTDPVKAAREHARSAVGDIRGATHGQG